MHLTRARGRFFVAATAMAILAPALAPADVVQEQQERLPPPAECTDPVAGIWMSHAFYPHVSQWYIFTLSIGRVPGDPSALAGAMHAVYWNGTAATVEPPACAPGVYRKAIDEPAHGSLQAGGRVVFEGTSWTASRDGACGDAAETGYNLDHFSGTIDPARQEFQSVLNAPGWVDVPTVFRRVRCAQGTAAPPPVTPPVFVPPPMVPPPPAPPTSGGCGCRNLLPT